MVKVYKDTEKYKSRGRVVEPSGTRADRPGFKLMLADAREDRFDVIVSWREDRLYRGFSPLALVGEMLEETDIDIELAKESFDKRMMSIKAAIAKLELDAIQERTMMGKAARLREGKLSMATPTYGYDYDPKTGTFTVNEEEAHWVRMIYQWFGESVGRTEIRRRLIEAGAPQKLVKKQRKHKWALATIDKILRREEYHTGLLKHKIGKQQTYELSIPIILDARLADAVRERRERWKQHPAGNWKGNTLLAGLIYCQHCGVRMSEARTTDNGRLYRYYQCQSIRRRASTPECCKSVRIENADWNVWGVLWELLMVPGRFELAIQERMKQLQAEEADASADTAALERQLDDLMMERQRVIGLARKGLITDDDLSAQLMPLTMAEKSLKRELQDRQLLTGNQAARLMDLIDIFRKQVQDDLAALHPDNVPVDEEQAREQFKTKRRFIEALVKKVEVTTDKDYRIHLEAGLSNVEGIRDDSLLINIPLSRRSWSNRRAKSLSRTERRGHDSPSNGTLSLEV